MSSDLIANQLSSLAIRYMDSAYHSGNRPEMPEEEQMFWNIFQDELDWFIRRGQMPAPYSSFLGCAGIGYLIVHLTACHWHMSSKQAMLRLRNHTRSLLLGPSVQYADYMLASMELTELFKLMLDRVLIRKLSKYLWQRAIGIRSEEHVDGEPATACTPNNAIPTGIDPGALRIFESRRLSGFHDVHKGGLGADWRWDVAKCRDSAEAELFERDLLYRPGEPGTGAGAPANSGKA